MDSGSEVSQEGVTTKLLPVRLRDGEGEPRVPISRPLPPPSTGAPPATVPPEQIVDEAYVAGLAQGRLPTKENFLDFVTWSVDELPDLANQVVEASAVNLSNLESAMASWVTAVTSAETGLNNKNVPVPPPDSSPSPPMPGLDDGGICTSTFAANDLALRGRRSVLDKRFYLPVIFPQVVLGDGHDWVFGQKVEYRQEWRHEGFTLGELISSTSLLPGEELTLEVSSWQRTRSEVSEETDEQRREAQENELRRTDEESTTNEAAASNGWTVAATGSVSYGPAASASVSASATGSTSDRAEQAERHIAEATTRATNEVSLRRAVKMTQTTEAGSEQRTTRRITNPNACHTVTYNFFQIVKLYDVQLRLQNDAPTVMLPGIFPAFYSPAGDQPALPVAIPYWTIEAFTSPAVFLAQFFEIDRELSQEINGFGLRARIDIGRSPSDAVNQLAQALLVAVKYLLGLDPTAHLEELAQFVAHYVGNAQSLRQRTAATYGVGLGRTEQVTTPGIYADSLLGHCSACEDYVEASRYVDVMRAQEEWRALERQNALLGLEQQRRQRLLDAKKLEPFESPTGSRVLLDIRRDNEGDRPS